MKKHVLICVAGATPQIITETLYALSAKRPPVYVDELYVITTTVGKELIERKLLQERILLRLLEEYNLPELKFNTQHIILIKAPSGVPLNDIKTYAENEATGDLITELIRDFTARPDVVLHCSIAGGRKTMSYYLGAALQLFGRPEDKLYHVLVSPEFEANPEFYYPPKKPRLIRCRTADGSERMISTAEAEVYIAELPFVRLREKITLQQKPFRELVREVQEDVSLSIPHLPLKIDLKLRRVFIGTTEVALQPMPLSLYALLAVQKIENCQIQRPHCGDCTACYMTMTELIDSRTLDRVFALNRVIYGGPVEDDRWQTYRNRGGVPQHVILQHFSKINRIIKNIHGNINHSLYTIDRRRSYGSTTYGLRIDRTRIEIIPQEVVGADTL